MKKRHATSTVVLLLIIAMVLTSVMTTIAVHRAMGVNRELFAEVRQIWEAREIIAARYVGQTDDELLTQAALAATVAALGDPWSRYLTPEAHEAHLRNALNQTQGIGISFTRDEETNDIVIVALASGAPAERAGLEVDETILTIEGYPTRDLDSEEIRQIIGTQFGYHVELEVLDISGNGRTVQVAVEEFYTNPVSYEMLEDDIGYIRIENFDANSAAEAITAFEFLINKGAVGIIFDVRRNGGGRLNELLAILDFLLPEGELFVYEDADGRERVRMSDENYFAFPMAVLIDEHSFSAAEFFAAILQEYEWAEIVGVPTTGKSRSQVTIPLSAGGAVHISTSRYFTPGRVDLYETGGVQPDHFVENDDSDVDAQLEAAKNLLQR